MSPIIPLLVLSCFLFLGCQPSESNSNAAPEIPSDANARWQYWLNHNKDTSIQVYAANPVKILANGSVIEGLEPVLTSYDGFTATIDTIFSEKTVIANREQTFEYEIGGFTTNDKQQFKHLIIWSLEAPVKKRLLEVIAATGPVNSSITDSLAVRRTEWMERCNQHNAKDLVEKVYTSNAIYYNHKPVVIGHEDITKVYQYMNDERYSLTLQPIHIAPINEKLAFEIGQCSGSYGGKYLFLWEKQEDGTWSVLMDSNI